MSAIKYGLSIEDLKNVDYKIEKQKQFLRDYVFDFGDGQSFNLLDSTMSANVNPKKYFAEVNNRVNSLFQYAKNLGLYPVFLTMTLPDRFHTSSKNYDHTLTVRDGVSYLSDMWAKFTRLKLFNRMKKAINHNMIYIRVVEPHKSGVPHCHVLLFVPKNYIVNRDHNNSLKHVFKRHFSRDGASTYAQNFKYVWTNDRGGAAAYILKYLNKTFKHALEDKMTLEAYYYARHSIRRFTTSQTLVPLYIHRSIKHDERFRNFMTLTHAYKLGYIYHLFNKKFIFYRCLNEDKDEEIIYQKNAMIDQLFIKSKHSNPTRIKAYSQLPSSASVLIDNKQSDFVFAWGRFYVPQKPYHKFSDMELYKYYRDIDYSSVDENHYIYIRNLCIDRGLVEGEKFGFDEYKSIPF